MSTTIETYQIRFVTRFIQNGYKEQMYSINHVLSQFVNDYKTIDEVNDFLISEIDNVIDGISASETIVSESMVSAEITSSVTNLFQDPDATPTDPPDISLPTSDLKEIAEAWLNYLTQSPM